MLCVLLLCALGACRSTPARYYVLSPGQPSTSAKSSLTIGVGPVTGPEYLDRLELVVRHDKGELVLRRGHLWAEPVLAGFQTTLIENLRRLLGTSSVVMHPWSSQLEPDAAVEVRVEQFDVSSSGEAVLRISYAVQDATAGPPKLLAGTYRQQASGKEPADLIEALSATVYAFSKDLAEHLAQRAP